MVVHTLQKRNNTQRSFDGVLPWWLGGNADATAAGTSHRSEAFHVLCCPPDTGLCHKVEHWLWFRKKKHEHIAGQPPSFFFQSIFKRTFDIIWALMSADHFSPCASNSCVEGGLELPTVWVFSSAPLCSFISFASRSQTLAHLNQITITAAG